MDENRDVDHRNHPWSGDFECDRSHDGRAIMVLPVIDEFTRQCRAIVVDRRITGSDVLSCMADLFLLHGIPEYIRSDNGSEFTARFLRNWLQGVCHCSGNCRRDLVFNRPVQGIRS